MKDRETERETERQRQTERHTKRQTERHTESQRDIIVLICESYLTIIEMIVLEATN